MTFEQWLTANGYDAAALTDAQRKHLEAAWKAETAPPAAGQAPTPASPSAFDEQMAAIERENQRIAFIRECTVKAAEKHVGDKDKVQQIKDLGEAAVADKKMDQRAFELAMLRLDRSIGPMVMSPRVQPVTAEVVEAAMCRTERLPELESHFDEPTLAAADRHFKRGLGIQEFLTLAAERNGNYRGSIRDLKPLLRAAFNEGSGYDLRAEGPSTLSVSGILSNIANKFLRVAFMAVEQSFRKICAIKPANDFKTMTTYSLVGDLTYQEVGPGGEIKHGTLGQTTYTNQARSYARLLGLDRRDIVNDDLGAFTSAGKRLGRGGALKLNQVFWAAFNAISFFTSGNNNYDTGAGSALGLTGLTNADSTFRSQTDPDGNPLGLIPRILLVPTALRVTAWNLMNSQFINLVTATSPSQGTENAWRGMFEPVDSVYISAANGGSDSAWYLLADPEDLPLMEICFLYGVEMPTIESGEMEIDRLGIAMRGYHDFGASAQEYRAGVKMAGS